MHVRDPLRSRPQLTPEQRAEDAADDQDFQICAAYVRDHSAGEVEGMYGPSSITWEIWREPVLLLAGVPAVLMQVAHPAIGTGVARLSNFREDILGRARATFSSLYQLVFGDLSEAQKASRRLHLVHRRVRGVIEEPGGPLNGKPYRANQQELLRWVGGTVAMFGRDVFECLIRPLGEDEKDRWYREFLIASASSGVRPDLLPARRTDYERWYAEQMENPDLWVGPLAKEIADAIFNSPVTRGPFDEMLAAGLLPPKWREAYGLRWGTVEQAGFRTAIAGLRAGHRISPGRSRYVVAWHQAQLRLAWAKGKRGSMQGRLLNTLEKRVSLPTAIRPIAEGMEEPS
jgi:uncharacterized protein (DUF2236 family)